MRIAILVANFPPKWIAGTEIAAYNIAKYLVKKGHEVHVVTSWDEGLSKNELKEGFVVHRIPRIRIKLIGAIIFWIKVIIELRMVDPDIIHSQGIDIGVPGLISKKLIGCSLVVWGQGSDIYLNYVYNKRIINTVLKNADCVIALTEDMKGKMQAIVDRQIEVIPNGINYLAFVGTPKKDIFKNLSLSRRNKIIVFAGTLRSIKGVRYLIKSMDIISHKNTDVILMIIGNGEEREFLENLVRKLNLEKRIIFMGQIPNGKIPEYLRSADIFVLPSLSESLGIVNLEAMASGLPIIASKVGGIPEIIKEGVNGFLVEPGNPEAIAEKVLYILGDPEIRKEISHNNIERAKEYDWDRIVDKLNEIYDRL